MVTIVGSKDGNIPMTLVPLYRGGTQPVKTGMKQEARTTCQSIIISLNNLIHNDDDDDDKHLDDLLLATELVDQHVLTIVHLRQGHVQLPIHLCDDHDDDDAGDCDDANDNLVWCDARPLCAHHLEEALPNPSSRSRSPSMIMVMMMMMLMTMLTMLMLMMLMMMMMMSMVIEETCPDPPSQFGSP